jgi:hypothetical protein
MKIKNVLTTVAALVISKSYKKQLVTTLLASTFMAFAATATATTINVPAGATVSGPLTAATTITIGANATVTGDVSAGTTLTLGAGAVDFCPATVRSACLAPTHGDHGDGTTLDGSDHHLVNGVGTAHTH